MRISLGLPEEAWDRLTEEFGDAIEQFRTKYHLTAAQIIALLEEEANTIRENTEERS